jgi:biopolymer transport protein ExbD
VNLDPRRAEDPEVNLISLIDVVLMIVVFFMLSSTFIDEGRVRIRLPEASAEPTPPSAARPIVVAIAQGGGYRVNEQELVNSSPETLRAALIAIAGQDRSAAVTIRADARTTHQSVVTAMDVLGRLGFREIDIATVSGAAPPAAPAGR